jgi:uncharacterized membrane protein YkoI
MTETAAWRRAGALPGLAAAVLLALGAVPARAQSDQDLAKELREAGEIVPFGLILAHAMEHHPGRVLNVKFEDEDEHYRYEVEVVDHEGVVWALFFDARTGDLLERIKEEDEIHREGD